MLPSAVKELLALTLKLFLRDPEAGNSRRDFLALSRETFFAFGHEGPLVPATQWSLVARIGIGD